MASLLQSANPPARQSGFTLAELAIVLLIVGLLLAGLLIPLSAQIDLRRTGDTQRTLEDVREALIGFSLANGRLPCPASSSSKGQESLAGGTCTNFHDGFVPGVTLNVAPLDADGYVLDGWNNRLRYATARNTASPYDLFTTSDGMKNKGMANLTPNLYVCAAAPATPGICGGSTPLAAAVPAVIFSPGPNGAAGSGGSDDNYNSDSSKHTVATPPVPVYFVSNVRRSVPGNEFDDLVLWLSPNILYSRMVTAGRLP